MSSVVDPVEVLRVAVEESQKLQTCLQIAENWVVCLPLLPWPVLYVRAENMVADWRKLELSPLSLRTNQQVD
jgi:hypothetical protein